MRTRYIILSALFCAILSLASLQNASAQKQWWRATGLSAGKCLLSGEIAKLEPGRYCMLVEKDGKDVTVYLYDEGLQSFLASFKGKDLGGGSVSAQKTFKDKRKMMGINVGLRYVVSMSFIPSGEAGALKATIKTKALKMNLADLTASSVKCSAPEGYVQGSEKAVDPSADTFFINTPENLEEQDSQ